VDLYIPVDNDLLVDKFEHLMTVCKVDLHKRFPIVASIDEHIMLQGLTLCGIMMGSTVPYTLLFHLSLITHCHSGLIRYKLVIHAFVDGFSRYVTGIQVVNNNWAATVVALFHKARAQHGTPSRLRGDHGVENVLVAAAMEDIRGLNRGSYIWGRHIHSSL
jgi:hypothetical protein